MCCVVRFDFRVTYFICVLWILCGSEKRKGPVEIAVVNPLNLLIPYKRGLHRNEIKVLTYLLYLRTRRRRPRRRGRHHPHDSHHRIPRHKSRFPRQETETTRAILYTITTTSKHDPQIQTVLRRGGGLRGPAVVARRRRLRRTIVGEDE